MGKLKNMVVSGLMVLLSAQALFSLDASINFYAADRYFFRFVNQADTARFQNDVTLSGDIIPNLNLSGTLWSSHRMEFLNGGFTVPEELDYQLCLAYNSETWSLFANASVYTAVDVAYEPGLVFDYYLATGLDVVSFTLEAAAYSDLKGFYQEIKVQPEIALPTSPMIAISLPITLGVRENGYWDLLGTGLTGIQIAPRIKVLLGDNWHIALSGGYFASLDSAIYSYPFVMVKAGFTFGSDKASE